MKNLIITLEYPPQVGGIASYAYNLAGSLVPDQTVVYAPKVLGDKEFDARNAWKTYRQNIYFSFLWPKWLRAFWQVKSIINREKIEQLYIHHVLPMGYVGYLIKKFKKIPYTIFLHGTDLELASRFKRNKLARVCREASLIVVNSVFLKNKLLAKLENVAENKILIIYPSPADNFLQNSPKEELQKIKDQLALNGKKVILTVARMEEGKGYPHLLRLLPEVLLEVPNAVCVLVGDGPKMKILLEMMQKEGLQNSVRFMGAVPNQELHKYYQLADVFVLLTHLDEEREEGWGTVFLEAAACGLPVVAGRAGGVEEAVLDQVTGFIVNVYQEKEVVSAIVKLLKDEGMASQMGTAGQDRVLRQYNWSNQINKLPQ